MAKIGIVIPVYNGEKYLPQTVQSVLAQTLNDWELVIVDDGSTDGTFALAQSYVARDARIRAFRQENSGVASARNQGFGAIDPDADYIIFLDADDVWEPEALETLVAALDANQGAVAAYGLMRTIDGEGNMCAPGRLEGLTPNRRGIVGKRPVPWPRDAPTTFAVLVYDNIIVTSGQVLIRRGVMAEVGPFDGSMAQTADWDMWLRLSRRGDIALVDKLVLSYRRHEQNMSSRRQVMHQSGMRTYQKLFTAPDLTPEQRRLVGPGYRWNRRINSDLYWQWAKENMAQGQWWPALKQMRHVLIELTHFYVGGTRFLPPR